MGLDFFAVEGVGEGAEACGIDAGELVDCGAGEGYALWNVRDVLLIFLLCGPKSGEHVCLGEVLLRIGSTREPAKSKVSGHGTMAKECSDPTDG